MKKIIFLQQIGDLDRSYLRNLRKSLKWFFKKYNLSVEILDEQIPLSKAEYSIVKKKFNADLIMIKFFKFNQNKNYFRTLGIMDEDIYVSTYNFIFGTARNPLKNYSPLSPIALISITRLREEFWDKPKDQALFELRMFKEAIHELGHTFGLLHCEKECVMIFSNWIGDTDKKPPYYCKECSEKILNFINFKGKIP